MSHELSEQEKTTLDVVQKMYSAFDKNDIPAVLATQADDVVWHVGQGERGAHTSPDPKLPYAGTFNGHAGLMQFFKALGDSTRFRGYERDHMIVQGDRVVVIIHDMATALNTGCDYDTWLIHEIVVKNGKVAFLWNHIDTGPIMAARAGRDK